MVGGLGKMTQGRNKRKTRKQGMVFVRVSQHCDLLRIERCVGFIMVGEFEPLGGGELLLYHRGWGERQ